MFKVHNPRGPFHPIKTSVAIALCWLLFLHPSARAGTWLLRRHEIPRIKITPNSAFIEQPVKILLRDFPAGKLVTVQLLTTNLMGRVWQSHAEFLTDRHGDADLSTQAPQSGTYSHVDSGGLFWSLSPADTKKAASMFTDERGRDLSLPLHLTLTASVNGGTIATATMERFFSIPGVRQIQVRDNGLRGTLFLPAGKGPWPGVIVLGGSEGGLPYLPTSAYLASKGYAALALAYFRFEDLPTSLENIPLEYFQNAIHWLQSRADVRRNDIGVLGGSRGGELALLLGATFPQIHAVVSFSGSGVLWGGLGTNASGPSAPAWIYQGKPLPFMGTVDLTDDQNKELWQISRTNSEEANLTHWLFELDDKTAVAKASIPVEKINGPVLLISGEDDKLWPSTQMEDMVMKRLKDAHHSFSDHHLTYRGVGHVILIPNVPTTGRFIVQLGGDPEHTAAANSWPRIIDFLNQSLNLGQHAGQTDSLYRGAAAR